ncbi:FkbM family methyltransferase [Dickeya fangzhongdai]|uniref:FkbM family methyltransferase n=1 Tax=Dickeya fangzhongdai TaxID=1778540 RepID=UPI0026DFAFA0|nr:FkbM family methyltransferase [Dickeya fangzhongdai]WKV50495.1 FkbM family methyltransferase [Dickeya fangzhongdai]
MNIQHFIENEEIYFAPMLERQKNATEEDKLMWRTENVHQRRQRVSLELFQRLQGKVAFGPFKNLLLTQDTWWGKSDLGSMLLGLYEKEILDFICHTESNQFDTFIDIGAADGYYACGMLLSKKVRHAICFEQNKHGQEVIAENWRRNGAIGELQIFGEANSNNLSLIKHVDFHKALMLIDIEGAEFDVLNEAFIEKIQGATIIIEIHNWIEGFLDKYRDLLHILDQYFNINVLDRVERPTVHLDILRDFTDDNRLLLTSEARPCLMRFLLLTPKN